MPSLSSIKSPNRSVAVPFNGVDVQITYDPNVITPRLEEDMNAATAAGASTVKQFLGVMVKWIVGWDLTADVADDAPAGTVGEPLPITVEVLTDFPDTVLSAITKALMADMRPNPTSS